MLNTFTSRDILGILQLSQKVHDLPEHSITNTMHPKKHKERAFEKAFFVTHADIFDFYADEHIDNYVS